jgi:hypothetical protein
MTQPSKKRAACGLIVVSLTVIGFSRRAQATEGEPRVCAVELEEVVTRYTPANNGAGPMWCYGSTVIARHGHDVFVSTIETGEGVPLLCNTRWQLWRRDADRWRLEQAETQYRQREPCPLAIVDDGTVYLSVNPSTEPPGVKYGPCKPLVLEFDAANPGQPPATHEPAWAQGGYFTDHSYRGFAADGDSGELLLLNIDARTGEQFVSHRDRGGRWHARDKIRFPIRSCYPQVALRSGAAHVLAIGDIVEPNEAWRELKFEKRQSKWDYVFRRLFYTYTPDIGHEAFCTPVEIDTTEETCGHISNLDLHVATDGIAHLLYLKRPYQYDFIRDRYFPGRAMTTSLEHVTVRDGRVRWRRTLVEWTEGTDGLQPSYARFHVDTRGTLWVILAGTEARAGQRTFGNFIARMPRTGEQPEFRQIDLKHPFGRFFTNTTRGGSRPSDFIDLFGTADDSPNLRYARLCVR